MSLKFEKLTRHKLRQLKANEKIMEHGITFERLANGDGRFSVNIMVDGQRIHRVIGNESDGTTRTQAEDFIQKAKQEAKEGRLNLPKGRKLILCFDTAADNYLIKLEQEDGKNLKAKKSHLNLQLKPFFKSKPLNKITNTDIEQYKKMRLDNKISQATINRELATLSHFITKAIEWKWLDTRPFTIERYQEQNGRIIYLTVEQANTLLEKAKLDDNPQIYTFIMMGLETSMRKIEILSTKIANIDLHRNVIFLSKAKAGAREQPITPRLARYLAEYLKHLPLEEKWLFPSKKSKTGYTVAIEKPYRRVVEKAGLDSKEVVRHTMRHTAITHLVQAGVDLPTVQRISGHKTLQMVMKYSHQNGQHIQAAMEKLEQRYMSSNKTKNNETTPSTIHN